MPTKKLGVQAWEEQDVDLPPGVKLLRTLEGHKDTIANLAFDPSGAMLASGGYDKTVKVWDFDSGALLRTLEGHRGTIFSVAFSPMGKMLASGSFDTTVRLWDLGSGRLLRTLVGHESIVSSIAFDPTGQMLAGGGRDRTVKLWEVGSGKLLRILEGHSNDVVSVAFDPLGWAIATASRDNTVRLWEVASGRILHILEGHGGFVLSVAFDPTGQTLASGSRDNTVKLWEVATGKLLRTLEGHTRFVEAVAFSADGTLLAAKSNDGTLRIWNCETWEVVSIIPEPARPDWRIPALAFHPTLPLLATVGSKPDRLFRLIHFWELDLDGLTAGKMPEGLPAMRAVHHTTAKIVLVGDSGVGKTGLGWRLAHGEFKEHASTHGQQFWVVSELGKQRQDDTECEAILWDLAGQPDYRLTHALFIDDADLALVLFDPTDSRDPLHGVEFWLSQLKTGHAQSSSGKQAKADARSACSTILVGARADRGEARLTKEELDAFCQQRDIIGGFLSTSACTGTGLEELVRRMQEQIPWDQKPATVTTVTFKRIKDYVLGLKENPNESRVIVSPQDLRKRLEAVDDRWEFTDDEMMTAVGHLANYGYVRVLRSSKSGERILLAPELLNNLAASFVLEARRNPKGLGSLEEKRLLAGDYPFRELENLTRDEQENLLDSVALLFLEHNICFRETDPLAGRSYLVFPELINLKKPLEGEQPAQDGMAYTVSGATENVYASLVVLLGYTQTFTRTNQWRSQARYEVGDGLICGFRQENERDGELDLVLYFGTNVGRPVRTLFQGLFESFLARRNVSVFRYEPVACRQCQQPLDRAVVRERLRGGKDFAYCPECSAKLTLPKSDEPIQLRQEEQGKVDEQRWFADQRTRFEQAVFQLLSYAERQHLAPRDCFISYAWGSKDQERWVERSLAPDLQKAGLDVVLDKWENDRAGKSVSHFEDRIAECGVVVPVGTPLYFEKFRNRLSSAGSVVASEVDLISQRLMGAETEKETVMPILLDGERKTSLPPLMWDRVHCDFRNARDYFTTAFDLILDLYSISRANPAVADLRDSLRDSELR